MAYYADLNHFKGTSGYEIDGVWYPRVTKIVEIKAKPALYKFYSELNSFSEGESVKKLSADEGTLIHNTIEAVFLNKNPEIPPSIAPSISAFFAFLEKTRVQVDTEFIEKRVVNLSERYAGTIDALALIDGKFGILDIKTSQAIYRDYNLQTSAYMAALQDSPAIPQTRWILRLDQSKTCLKCGSTLRQKGGRDKIRPPKSKNGADYGACGHEWSEMTGMTELQEFPYWKNDYNAFLGAKQLWEWENEYWLKKAGYF